jgi:two-component system, LytTR family, response regulator LytT
MKVVVIEDEPLAAEQLCDYARRYDPEIAVLGVLTSVKESVCWFREHAAPDLILSDIELLDGDVFRLFEQLEIPCPIIFTTAYDHFLQQAFDRNGIGYLLKPLEYEKFAAAMRKFEQFQRSFTLLGGDLLRELKSTLAQPRYKERFVIKARGGIYLLEARRVAYIQIRDEIPFAYDEQGARYPLNETLSQLEKTLDPLVFFRLSRSEIVNLNFIERLEPYFNDRMAISLKRLNVTLISSISRTPELRRWIEGNLTT